jgi:SAM-dependent methyltransferase
MDRVIVRMKMETAEFKMSATIGTPISKLGGFPRKFLPVLRCAQDAGELSLLSEAQHDDTSIIEGMLRCKTCSHEYPIQDGIVRLMLDALTQETRHEIALKDEEYEAMSEEFTVPSDGWRSEFLDRIEVPPHMAAVQPLDGRRVLELGCGDGRFTILMAQQGAEVLAVDFSFAALRKLRRRLPSGKAPTSYLVKQRLEQNLTEQVGLVQADASAFHVAPLIFDRALSATPLDDRDERMKMFRTVSECLKDAGRYVAGVEYDYLQRRMLGLPVARRYTPGGIFIEHFDMATMRREMAPYFSRVRMSLIRARVPFVKKLPMSLAVNISLAVCAIPLLRQLGDILLVRAENPIRLPVEGLRRTGWFGVKRLYRWYKRRKGEEATWDAGELV